MEASSPSSVAASRPPRSGSGPGVPELSRGNASVPISLPLRFLLTGLLSLLAGTGFLIARPDILASYHYNQYVIAVTHLFVLGFACTIVMGALYQLVPVALETRLYSERLARWQYVAHTLGFAGMVWMFWIWNMKQVGHFGSLLALGAGWFVYNIARSLRTVPRWNVVAAGLAASVAWLAITISAGLYLACAKCWDFSPFNPIAAMHAHAHVGVAGIFVLLIVTVSLKLVPMFTLSEVRRPRRVAWALALFNAGLMGTATAILLQSAFKLLFALILAAGLAVYGIELRAILRTRRRRELDWGLRYFLTGVGLLAPVVALGIVLAWPGLPATLLTTQLENLYGFLAIVGVVGFAILGMLYKIVPFLVWYQAYSRRIGTTGVPLLAQMSSRPLQAAGYWSYLVGLVACGWGIVFASEPMVQAGGLLLAGSLGVLAVNMARIVSHLIRPRTPPLTPPPTILQPRYS